MKTFSWKKWAYLLLVLWGIATAIFFLFRGWGDPSRMMLGQSGDRKTMEHIRKNLHLDDPVWKQYLFYLNDLSPVSTYDSASFVLKEPKGLFIGHQQKWGIKFPELGYSYQSGRSVSSIIVAALPATVVLALAAILVAILLGISLGVFAALRKGSIWDRISILISSVGISTPSFFAALIMAFVFGALWAPYTGLHFTGSLFEIDEYTGEKYLALKNLILPALTLALRPLAIITQLTRSSMLEVLQMDYIRTAYAKGLDQRSVIIKHALPHCFNPLLTAVSTWLAEMMAGAFFIEFIFGWQGIGKITVDALEKMDLPVLTGSLLCTASIFVLVNFCTDLLYRRFDPRIRE
jgi:peptide/nickel transport system permease protein